MPAAMVRCCGLRSMALGGCGFGVVRARMPEAILGKRGTSTWVGRGSSGGVLRASYGSFGDNSIVGQNKGLLGEERAIEVRRLGGSWRKQMRGLSMLPEKEKEKEKETQAEKKSSLPILHENIYTLPNFLTVTRLLCAPAIGQLLLTNNYTWALGLFVYAGVTDLVDGWIARRWGSQTVVGTVLDPMADKALMTVVVGVLGWEGAVPAPLAILILGRDVLLSLTAFYYRYVSLPPPRTMKRYWDFSLPSAEVKPTSISKVNTFLQLGLIGATMAGLAFPMAMGETAQSALEVSWWVVGGTTVWSGASYLGRGGVRILGKKGG